jgi:hypothetical protein
VTQRIREQRSTVAIVERETGRVLSRTRPVTPAEAMHILNDVEAFTTRERVAEYFGVQLSIIPADWPQS